MFLIRTSLDLPEHLTVSASLNRDDVHSDIYYLSLSVKESPVISDL